MQGRSLMPLLKGATPVDWRAAFYYHYYEYPDEHRVRPHYGDITERYTLVHFYQPEKRDPDAKPFSVSAIPNDYWELFDREKDPGEMRSVFGNPAYADVQTNLMQEVVRLRGKFNEPAKDDPKAFGPQ
jgi:hypothetical protein